MILSNAVRIIRACRGRRPDVTFWDLQQVISLSTVDKPRSPSLLKGRWRGATEGEIFAYRKPATSLSSHITRTKKEQIRRLAPLINYSSRFLRRLPRTATAIAIPPRQTAILLKALSPVAGEGTNSSGFVSRSIICESSSIQSE